MLKTPSTPRASAASAASAAFSSFAGLVRRVFTSDRRDPRPVKVDVAASTRTPSTSTGSLIVARVVPIFIPVLVSIALVACGGSGDSSTGAGAQATASSDGTASVQHVLATTSDTSSTSTAATTSDTTGWTTIATENATFTLTGTQTVRYGAGSSWVSMQFTGSGTCSNSAFNTDPAPGIVKSCQVASTDTTAWTTIATENATFTVTGTQTVRYGAGSSWVSMQFTGGGTCSNSAFNTDPAPNVVKSCQVASTDTTDTTAWTTIATENGTFIVTGTQTVRYGAGTSWVSMQFTGGGTCSNSVFNTDPAPGVVKSCQVASSSSTTVTWTKIASENASFTVSGTQTVRYGSGSSWVTQTVTGSGVCSNGFFGVDPLPNVVKECDVASSGATTTAGVCTPAITATDTSSVAATVGNGTPASCTEAALRAAVNANSVIRFSCGAATATIPVSAPIVVPTTRDTVIDGENRIILDGGGTTRLISITQNNFRTNSHGLTLQHISLRNGSAPASGYVAQDPANPNCAYGYAAGGGGAIDVVDAVLHVIDVDFRGNAAANLGPDIGGGAIHASGSLDVTVTGSSFTGNSGANGGSMNMLNSNLRLYNSLFQTNKANGLPQPNGSASTANCPGVDHAGQGGAGGAGGGVYIDGGYDAGVVVCGTNFVGNQANTLAGALLRVPDYASQHTTIDRSNFTGNTAPQAGAVYIMNSVPLDILASTFSGNKATIGGAAQLQSSQLNIVNTTFSGNESALGVGGALLLNGSTATSQILNSTFADNKASGGPAYFSAAIFGDNNFPILNTVFSNNLTTDPYNPMQCTFNPSSGANDLQWPLVRAAGGLTDTACVTGITFADPLLGALADNGGPTQTRLPASNSPLRNAGRNCPATDQRGNARNAASCTVGAVE